MWKIVIIIIILAAGTTVYLFNYGSDDIAVVSSPVEAMKKQYWIDVMKKSEFEAEEELLKMAIAYPVEAHEIDHAYGAALYELNGPEGIIDCSDEVRFGCMHEMFILYANEFGVGEMGTLVELCLEGTPEINAMCDHGFGHALPHVYGFDIDGINQALNACERHWGCPGGIFMEMTRLAKDGVVELSDYYPCTEVPYQFKFECYHWHPLLWEDEFAEEGLSVTERFIEFGELCRSIPEQESYEENCFSRMGKRIPHSLSAPFSPDEIIDLCDQSTNSNSEYFYCITYSAGMATLISDQQSFEDLCLELPLEHQASCRTLVTHEGLPFGFWPDVTPAPETSFGAG